MNSKPHVKVTALAVDFNPLSAASITAATNNQSSTTTTVPLDTASFTASVAILPTKPRHSLTPAHPSPTHHVSSHARRR